MLGGGDPLAGAAHALHSRVVTCAGHRRGVAECILADGARYVWTRQKRDGHLLSAAVLARNLRSHNPGNCLM